MKQTLPPPSLSPGSPAARRTRLVPLGAPGLGAEQLLPPPRTRRSPPGILSLPWGRPSCFSSTQKSTAFQKLAQDFPLSSSLCFVPRLPEPHAAPWFSWASGSVCAHTRVRCSHRQLESPQFPQSAALQAQELSQERRPAPRSVSAVDRESSSAPAVCSPVNLPRLEHEELS